MIVTTDRICAHTVLPQYVRSRRRVLRIRYYYKRIQMYRRPGCEAEAARDFPHTIELVAKSLTM